MYRFMLIVQLIFFKFLLHYLSDFSSRKSGYFMKGKVLEEDEFANSSDHELIEQEIYRDLTFQEKIMGFINRINDSSEVQRL
jgi:hypothetical protein